MHVARCFVASHSSIVISVGYWGDQEKYVLLSALGLRIVPADSGFGRAGGGGDAIWVRPDSRNFEREVSAVRRHEANL